MVVPDLTRLVALLRPEFAKMRRTREIVRVRIFFSFFLPLFPRFDGWLVCGFSP